MSQNNLLSRLMRHDMNAYLEMSDKYSWPVYSLIRGRISDKSKVDSVYNEIMNGFYKELSGHKTDDPLEAVLLMYADKVCRLNEDETADVSPVYPENRNSKADATSEKQKQKGSFLYYICVFLLISAILGIIWVILGLLMDMNFIPNYDLGYTWFNANVLPWF